MEMSSVALFFLHLIFLCILCVDDLPVAASPAHPTEDNEVLVRHPSSDMMLEEDNLINEKDTEPAMYVDVCDSYTGFEKISFGQNPNSKTVQLHPSVWVYVSRCRREGEPCSGFGGARSLCHTKRSWVQVSGRINDRGRWQPQWIAVDSSCACALKLFPHLDCRKCPIFHPGFGVPTHLNATQMCFGTQTFESVAPGYSLG